MRVAQQPRFAVDASGNKVFFTKGTTQQRIKDTTALRCLVGPGHLNALLHEPGNLLNNYTVSLLYNGAVAVWRRSFSQFATSPLAAGALLQPPLTHLAWFATRATNRDLAQSIVYFEWQDLERVTSSSPRLSHLLPLDRMRILTNNELASWSDWVLALQGLEYTYGLFYGPVYQQLFHRLHQTVLHGQIGSILPARYLEWWLLSVLAAVHRAARDPSLPLSTHETARFPPGTTATALTPDDWCFFLGSEFEHRLHQLTPTNAEAFTLSLSVPAVTSFPHPCGKFREAPPAGAVSNVATPGQPSVPLLPTAGKPAPTSTPSKPGPQKQPSTPLPKLDKKDRICALSLFREYNLPIKRKGSTTLTVPDVCPATCQYMHPAAYPSDLTKSSVRGLLRKPIAMYLDANATSTFNTRVNNDSRFK